MAEENLTGQTGLRREACTLHQMNRGDAAVEERVKAVHMGGVHLTECAQLVHLMGMYLWACLFRGHAPQRPASYRGVYFTERAS
jgi:hypothetical protein